jgi:hypothetical protein
VRPSTGVHRLTSGMRMRGMQAASCSLVLRCWDRAVADSRRAVPMHLPLTCWGALFLGCSWTRTQCEAYKKTASLGAILGHAEFGVSIWTRHFFWRGEFTRRGWTALRAAARGSVSVSVLVPVLALASVNRFTPFSFLWWCWPLIGRHCPFHALLICLVLFSIPFMCPLPKRRVRPPPCDHGVDGWLDAFFSAVSAVLAFYS